MIAKIIMETKICLERASTKKNFPNYNKDKVEKLIQKSLRRFFTLSSKELLRPSQGFRHTVNVALRDAGVVELGVPGLHVHPLSFEDKETKFTLNFASCSGP